MLLIFTVAESSAKQNANKRQISSNRKRNWRRGVRPRRFQLRGQLKATLLRAHKNYQGRCILLVRRNLAVSLPRCGDRLTYVFGSRASAQGSGDSLQGWIYNTREIRKFAQRDHRVNGSTENEFHIRQAFRESAAHLEMHLKVPTMRYLTHLFPLLNSVFY